jgi:thioredoxin reductase (NADPH)
MTAAIYAARAKLNTIVLEVNITGGLVNSTYLVENFPSYRSIHGIELMEKMRLHVDSFGVQVEELCKITRLELEGEVKRVITSEREYIARTIILATGRAPIPLEVQIECDAVHFCSICDGASYIGKRVLVVGGGNSAFDESQYLLSIGVGHITLVEIMDRFFAAQSSQDALMANDNVCCYSRMKVKDLIVNDGKLTSAILESVADGKETCVPVDGVFVFLGQKPNNGLFSDSVALDDHGYIPAAQDMSTNIPGIYAAGDIVAKSFRQIVTAVSDGAVAALSAERYVRSLKK